MVTRIGINGFGRICRQVLKAITDRHGADLEVVAINDLVSIETNAHLLKYDSNYGRWRRVVAREQPAEHAADATKRAHHHLEGIAVEHVDRSSAHRGRRRRRLPDAWARRRRVASLRSAADVAIAAVDLRGAPGNWCGPV